MARNNLIESDGETMRGPANAGRRHRFPVEFDGRLVEDAVELALQGQLNATYWRVREKIYNLEGGEERDRAFGLLSREEFETRALDEPIYRALDELPLLAANAEQCRVMKARSSKDEGAELFVAPARDDGATESGAGALRSVVLRVTPQAFSRPEGLLELLRHEFFHIADMLDPAFGYDPRPPAVEGDPARLKLTLNRYRVLWDTVIDGRLCRLGRGRAGARELRRREFVETFAMLGHGGEEAFTVWFDAREPVHDGLLRFACDPLAACGASAPAGGSVAICPLCRCPGVIDAPRARTLPKSAIDEILGEFPRWRVADGACPQCVELYRTRPMSRAAANALPGETRQSGR